MKNKEILFMIGEVIMTVCLGFIVAASIVVIVDVITNGSNL